MKFKDILEKTGLFDVKLYPPPCSTATRRSWRRCGPTTSRSSPLHDQDGGIQPQFQIVDMPFLFASEDAAEAFWASDKGKEMFNSLRRAGFIGLAQWTERLHAVHQPEASHQDTGGFQGAEAPRAERRLCSMPATRPWAQGPRPWPSPRSTRPSTARPSTVWNNTFNNHETMKFYEVAKYLTIGNFTRIDYIVMTNVKFWDSLKPDQQKLFTEAMKQATAYERSLSEDLNDKSLEIMKKSGKIEAYTLTRRSGRSSSRSWRPCTSSMKTRSARPTSITPRA